MLDIHVGLMFFVLALFLTLLVVLNRMLFQPLLKFMDDRDRTIAEGLEEAKGLSGESEELNAQAEENLSKARSEAAAIRQKAVEEAKASAAQKVEAKQAELDKAYAAFSGKLAEEKEKLKNELLSQMPLFKESLKAKFSKL